MREKTTGDLKQERMGQADLDKYIKDIVIHGILHHTPLTDINDKLFAENEKTLC